jgi:16S rRNA processing protein RimM
VTSSKTSLRVGRLLKAHGLKGAIKLELYTDSPKERFVPGAVLTLQVPNESPWFGQTVTVKEVRWYNNQPVIFLEGIDDRTQAETLIKAILLVDQDLNETPTEPDAWYDQQLVGLIIKTLDDKEVMLPFVKQMVPEVDIAGGKITITPPMGLFEEIEE